jgi:GTP pyrophosphokinase
VERTLRDNGIETLSIDFRAKRYASLYKKLIMHEMDIDQIYDLVAFRIVVKDISDCYAALGIIHKLWPPVPYRIKDYIAMPKPNGYQSIHTTVICDEKKFVEFQIRTEEMHEHAENGIAAHWAYENQKGKSAILAADKNELAWVKQLKTWQGEHEEPEDFIDSLKIDFFNDRIFAVTPTGEVVDLPRGATPIDFAYQIHSEVGDRCTGALVNNKMVQLDHTLHSGDIVEIITQKNKKPSKAWLNIAVTASAKSHIKNVLKKTETASSASLLQERQMSVEFLITAYNKNEIIQNVSTIISRMRIDIVSLSSNVSAQSGADFNTIRVRCATGDKEKVWKLLLKFKAIPEVKEVSYRFV